MKDVKAIYVPKHEDYKIQEEYKDAIKRIPNFIQYFPHYPDQ
jgi:hypothetical protein